ncbi:MAG: thymidylate synthase [Caldilineaceae bacterium]|nr:thymidylate synthase [Caldilineaceae bacterium]
MFSLFEGPTADYVWQQVVAKFRAEDGVLVQPSRGGDTREILHAAITIDDPRQRWVASRRSPLNIAFAFAELVWIMTGRNDLAFLQAWNTRLPDYVGKGPKLHGAYGYRLRQKGGVDQLTRAYQALNSNPNTRQAVLQIWDSSVDLPQSDGSPVSQDVPCNVFSLLKVRAGKLEWLQAIRSNDLYLGVPYDFVHFTSLQEVMAGWLGIDCGAYHQVSDSLHIYARDEERVFASALHSDLPSSTDTLAHSKVSSEAAFKELERRIERMIVPDLLRDQLVRISAWDEGPLAFRNMLVVLVSEAARRRGWLDISDRAMTNCTNPLYSELWRRWLDRMQAAFPSEPWNGEPLR